jgi:hypothetical protein
MQHQQDSFVTPIYGRLPPGPRSRYIAVGKGHVAPVVNRLAAPLLAAWQRAERGTGSEADAALWARFSTIGPDPQTLQRVASHERTSETRVASRMYMTLWRDVARKPLVNQYLGADETRPTALPSFVDVITAAASLVPLDIVEQAVRDFASGDSSTRRYAIWALLNAMEDALAARPMSAWPAAGRPAYAEIVPRDTGEREDSRTVMGPVAAVSGAARCDPRLAYYLLVAHKNGAPDSAFLSAPIAGQPYGHPARIVYQVSLGAFEGIDQAARYMTTFCSAPSNAPHHCDDGIVPPSLPDDAAAWLSRFMAALILVSHPYRGMLPNYGDPEWIHPGPIALERVRGALVPLAAINAIPPVSGLVAAIEDADEDNRIVSLLGAWIDECQLVAALRLFADQVATRQASMPFE